MRDRVKRLCSLILAMAMLNTASCGYLIYPERQGLRGDRIDGTVVALDAIGLLLILPGIIAFAVDLSTGCIYLPKDKEGPFSINAFPATNVASEGWIAVARVAPFADDATIKAALQNYLPDSSDAINSARIEWQPVSVFTPLARTN
jgi:hypothetical protein